MSRFELRTLPLAALTPAPHHPRRVPSPPSLAYRKLRASLAEFGLVEPLVWNETSGFVVGGHARLRVLAELGFTEAPVSVVRLSPAREKALNVALNNPKAQGRYDPSRLAALLAELADLPELELTGFTTATLRSLSFEPASRSPTPPVSNRRVEITLTADAAAYDELSARLNPLLAGWKSR